MTHITKPLAVLHFGEIWLAADAKHVQPIQAYPTFARSFNVIETFDDSPSGVVRLQGKTDHAAALIERKVRAEGLVDGESRILIHRQRTSAGAMEVLFTAVPLPVWQTISAWAQKQPDHCVVFPLAAVASSGIKQGQGRVVRCGVNLVYFADTSEGYFYASVAAYSADADDVEIAVRALAEQAAESHAGNTRGKSSTGVATVAQPLVFWCPLVADAMEDSRLRQLFADVSGCQLKDCGQAVLLPLDVEGQPLATTGQTTALTHLLQQIGIREAASTGLQRVAALAEACTPVSTALTAACAVALFAVGAYQHTVATSLNAVSDSQNAKSLQQEQMTKQIDAKQAPTGYQATQTFVTTLKDSISGYNPNDVTAAIRSAAGAEIRVLRVRLENVPGKPLSILLDGAVRTGADASAITAFLLDLRRAGYAVTSLDPADGGQSGNFTYRMVRLPALPNGQASTAATASPSSKVAL